MIQHTPINTAQRFAMFQVMDLAVEVTMAGKWVAHADYNGSIHLFDIDTFPAGGSFTDPEHVCLNVYFDHCTGADGAREITERLAEMIDHLQALLEDSRS